MPALVLLNAAFAALNVGLYVWLDHWWSLAAAVFSGIVALYIAMLDA